MGFSPEQTGRMSLWQFNAAFDGWLAAHRGHSTMDEKTFDELAAMLDREIEADEMRVVH